MASSMAVMPRLHTSAFASYAEQESQYVKTAVLPRFHTSAFRVVSCLNKSHQVKNLGSDSASVIEKLQQTNVRTTKYL